MLVEDLLTELVWLTEGNGANMSICSPGCIVERKGKSSDATTEVKMCFFNHLSSTLCTLYSTSDRHRHSGQISTGLLRITSRRLLLKSDALNVTMPVLLQTSHIGLFPQTDLIAKRIGNTLKVS